MEKEGLGVVMAAVFLAGEMAGSGVLAMPAAMVGTSQEICPIEIKIFFTETEISLQISTVCFL